MIEFGEIVVTVALLCATPADAVVPGSPAERPAPPAHEHVLPPGSDPLRRFWLRLATGIDNERNARWLR